MASDHGFQAVHPQLSLSSLPFQWETLDHHVACISHSSLFGPDLGFSLVCSLVTDPLAASFLTHDITLCLSEASLTFDCSVQPLFLCFVFLVSSDSNNITSSQLR